MLHRCHTNIQLTRDQQRTRKDSVSDFPTANGVVTPNGMFIQQSFTRNDDPIIRKNVPLFGSDFSADQTLWKILIVDEQFLMRPAQQDGRLRLILKPFGN